MNHITIGKCKIEKTAALAPMAGVADTAMRTLCTQYGASFVVGEMVSAKGLCYNDRKSAQLLSVTQKERPMAVQIFGDDPDFMARAAEMASHYAPDIIDINMGCPVPKVAGNGSGCALMRNQDLAASIVKAASQATDIPITVKIRKGWDDNSVNAVEFAQAMEQAGAKAITVHGRTRKQMYAGKADWGIIAAVKRAVKVPVIGNGDVSTAQQCVQMYKETGCDLVMVGRGALGNPWLFSEIRSLFDGGIFTAPDISQRMEVMLKHIEMLIADKGEHIGIKEARKHCAWYIKGLHGAARLRRSCGELSSIDDVKNLAQEVINLSIQAE